MQMKKQHWKKVREEVPCRMCGSKTHRTGSCPTYTRRGAKRNPDRFERW
jgi:hypothetical protein